MIKLFELDIPKQVATRKFSLCLLDDGFDKEHGRFIVALCFNGNVYDRASGFYTDNLKAAYKRFSFMADDLLENELAVYEIYKEVKKWQDKKEENKNE